MGSPDVHETAFFRGSKQIGDRASSQLKNLFERFAASAGFADAVREMRTKLEASEPKMSFKSSPGGTYDIDFITSYLMVKYGVPSRLGSLRDRLWRCVDAGRLDKSDAGKLDHAAELLRTAEHISRLVVGRPGNGCLRPSTVLQLPSRWPEKFCVESFRMGSKVSWGKLLNLCGRFLTGYLSRVVAVTSQPSCHSERSEESALSFNLKTQFSERSPSSSAECRRGPGRDGGCAGSAR